MAKTPEISIIIPVHNGAAYLANALNSVIDQTFDFRRMEIILIDDCSTDKTPEIIAHYASEHDNIFALKTDYSTGAAGHPRNMGLDAANGRYIMFLDSDDVYLDNACEFLFSRIEEFRSDIAAAVYYEENKGERTMPAVFNQLIIRHYINVSCREAPALLLFPPSIWSNIYSNDFLTKNNIRFPEEIIGEDMVFAAETFLTADTISYFKEPVYLYQRRHSKEETSVSLGNDTRIVIEACENKKLIQQLYDKEPQLDYFSIRYAIDIRYIVGHYLRLTELPKKDKNEMRSALTEFLRNYNKANLDYLSLSEELIVRLLAEKKYEKLDIIKPMLIQLSSLEDVGEEDSIKEPHQKTPSLINRLLNYVKKGNN